MSDVKINVDAEDSEKIYDQYRTGNRANYGTQIVEDRSFMMNAMWDTEDADALDAANEPALTTNEVTPSIDLVVSMLTENNPRFIFGGTESSDIPIASDISDLHAHIYDISNGQSAMKHTAMDYEVAGMGALMAYVDSEGDYGKGEILITDIDPVDLYIDPNSKKEDSSDSEHILVVKSLTQEFIKKNYPNLDVKKLQMVDKDSYPSSTRDTPEDQVQYSEFEGADTSKANAVKYRAIDRYTKVKVKRYHVQDTTSGYEKVLTQEQYDEFINEPAIILISAGVEKYITTAEVKDYIKLGEQTGGTFHLMIDPQSGQPVRMPGVEHPGAVPNSTTQIIQTTKQEFIETGVIRVDYPRVPRIKRVFTIGRQIVSNDILPVKDHPVVTYMAHHARTPYPMSDVRLVRPLQEQLNKMNSKIVAYLNNVASLNIFLPKGSGIKKQLDENIGKAGIKTYEYDPELGGIPIVAQMPSLPAGIFEDKQQVIYQIQRIIGAYAASDGNAAQMPDTKGGTILQDEFGQRRVNMKRKDLERCLNQLAKVIAQMIPHVYSEEKVVRITEPNRDTKEVRFNVKNADRIINDLSVGVYDVKVISGSTMPTNQLQRYELLNNSFQSKILLDNKALIENLPFISNIDEILEREDKLKQAMQQIQAMDEQIKKLSGDLQTAERETKSAKMRS